MKWCIYDITTFRIEFTIGHWCCEINRSATQQSGEVFHSEQCDILLQHAMIKKNTHITPGGV